MIDALGKLSVRCSRYRYLALVFGVVFLALFIYSLFNPSPGRIDFLVPSLVGIAWSLAFYAFSGLFLRVPERRSGREGLFRRVARRMQRFAFYVLGIGFVALTLVLLYLSAKMLAIWIGEIPG